MSKQTVKSSHTSGRGQFRVTNAAKNLVKVERPQEVNSVQWVKYSQEWSPNQTKPIKA